ncbi:MAG: HAMP domain-containing protein [Paludibacteraceae bacterium]|nr:HAMP domain-containing protein [Paludibacteraceae bacterium]
MKKVLKIVHFVVCVAVCSVIFTACHSLSSDGRHIQRTLERQQAEVMTLLGEVQPILERHRPDSLLSVSHAHPDIVFYVYDNRQLLFWSHNWLVANGLYRVRYDDWWLGRFDNAVGVGRWTKFGDYSVCTIIPIKFQFAQYSERLPNDFIAPFKADNRWLIRRQRANDGCYTVTTDGAYLFSLVPPEMEPEEQAPALSPDSFSYGSLFASPQRGLSRYHLLIGIVLLICIIFLSAFITNLVRSHGLKNMKMYTKVQYLVVALVLAGFVYIFFMSTSYVRTHYEQRQQSRQQAKARYIQASLRDLYFWDMGISALNTRGLNTDLRDLSYTYETDILVYDQHGQLVGSSVPQLLESGLISPIIAPEPYFTDSIDLVCYEQIGSVPYLTVYTPFYNGNQLLIGYIAVPCYVSSAQVEQEVAEYIGRFLPPYVLLLILAFVIAVFVTQRLTRNMRSMADTMHHFQLGKDNYIHYESNDELGELIRQYNAMVKQLEQSTTKLAQSERESAWRTMARQIAHEINNSLTPMKLSIQQLQRIKGTEFFDERFDHAARLLLEQFDDLGRIASTFSDFAKMPEVHPSETDIAEKLFSAVTLMRMSDPSVPIRYVGPESGVPAYADAEQVGHVFTNILKNALQALHGHKDSDIIVILKEADRVEISISDNGPGIPEAIRSKIFMPNFTTKSTGMGLGLAIAKNIVDGSEGTITFETSDKGTTFYIYFKKL